MLKNFYKVAGHVFSVGFETETLSSKMIPLMENYKPFEIVGEAGACDADSVFQLNVVEENEQRKNISFVEETRQEEEGQIIVCGHTVSGQSVFEFSFGAKSGLKKAGTLVCSADYRQAELLIEKDLRKTALDNALMVLFALATAKLDTVLFHGAVVSKNGKGYMFLGSSGTGKSTHARLWLKHIDGTELVNDDNPVVRVIDNIAWIYGSPWSGKTPCYKNLAMPLDAMVQLAQAPYNKIARLGGLRAYAVLVPSISGKRWDASIADGLHNTENKLAKTVPTYYLECLPDAAAAELCCKTCRG